MSDYEVRPYHPGDEEGIVELLELVFDGWPHFDLDCTPLEHWKWKYLDNPLKMVFMYLAICDDEIIGFNHTIPQRVKIGSDIILCGTGADVAVHPNFRRRGVNNNTRDSKFNFEMNMGVKLQYDIEINPILIERALRHGLPRFPHDIMVFVRIHDVDKQLRMMTSKNAWMKKYGFQLVKMYNKFRNTLRIFPSSDHDLHISEVRSFDDRISPFWDEVKDHYNFIVERNKDYLNWRYCDPRGGNYLIRQSEEDGRVLGFSVLRINRYREEYPIGYIVDLLTMPDRLDVANTLVEDAVSYFDNNDVNIIRCLSVKDHSYVEILNRYGFVYSREKLNIFYQFNENISKGLLQVEKGSENSIHFVFGNYDAI